MEYTFTQSQINKALVLVCKQHNIDLSAIRFVHYSNPQRYAMIEHARGVLVADDCKRSLQHFSTLSDALTALA